MNTIPRAVIFDLDGTLVDSLEDIGVSMNECLEILGLKPFPVQDYRYMVGEGIVNLCRRALAPALAEAYLNRLIELVRARYRTRCLERTRPYSGVPALVNSLRARGVALAVLSNKPHDMTERIVRALWPDDPFGVIQGYTTESARKPDPTHPLAICEKLGVAPAETVMVGDTPTDVETARRTGAGIIGVTWGFRTREELAAAGCGRIVDTPGDIAALFGLSVS